MFLECSARPIGVPMRQIGICVFIGAIKRKYELPFEMLMGYEIHAQDNR